MEEIHISPQSPERFAPMVGEEMVRRGFEAAARLRERLGDRAVWNVNSTARGGGVAELLRSLLAYARGAGMDARWVTIQGTPPFFRLTKRLHNALHGDVGDGSPLGEEEHRIYRETMRENVGELVAMIRPRDVVILHDPQTAGLIPHLMAAGALVIWRCHIGHDRPCPEVERGWKFLEPYLEKGPAFVFSRAAYIPDYCDHGRSVIIAPSIDPFSAKNQELDPATVRAILVHTGLIEGPEGSGHRTFLREDGSPGRVDRYADCLNLGQPPTWDTPIVLQVARWDRLKDPVGVVEGFLDLLDGTAPANAELILAGPNVTAVADDPEGAEVLEEVTEAWRRLPHAARRRVHLASLPMHDLEENAAIVNALQRHATVVVQKSLHEGFGLTVTEAMWKGKPVVASAVGGIQDQIEDGVSGVLIKQPDVLEEFTSAVRRVLDNPGLAADLGRNARERVRAHYLGLRSLLQYARLIERVDAGEPPVGGGLERA